MCRGDLGVSRPGPAVDDTLLIVLQPCFYLCELLFRKTLRGKEFGMAGSKFRSDRGVTSRMILTMVLLFVVYVLFIVGLVAAGVNVLLVIGLVGGCALVAYLSLAYHALFSVWATT